MVLEQLVLALQAMRDEEVDCARRAIAAERTVRAFELQADAEFFQLLNVPAVTQREVRTVMAASRLVGDLRRIGDEASKLANLTTCVLRCPDRALWRERLYELDQVASRALPMLEGAVDAFEFLDKKKLREVSRLQPHFDEALDKSLRRLQVEADVGAPPMLGLSLSYQCLDRIAGIIRDIVKVSAIVTRLSAKSTPVEATEAHAQPALRPGRAPSVPRSRAKPSTGSPSPAR
jgi:phosphate transport system protein